MVSLKVCGLTSLDDAKACASLGVRALGVRLTGSPGDASWALAASTVEALGDRVLVVGVVDARFDEERLGALKRATGVGCLQFEGAVAPERLRAHLPHAYVALPVVALAGDVEPPPGDYLMARLDAEPTAHDPGAWAALRRLARAKRLTLSAPFTPASAREALRLVRPYCLDLCAPGAPPGRVDVRRVEALLEAVRAAPGPVDEPAP
jgi:phosphoribosylanthranilate isomerase